MSCWCKLELMCVNFAAVADFGFLGLSCFSELLTWTSVVRYLECNTTGELLLLTIVALCRGLLGRRTKDFSQKTCKSAFRAEFKALFLPMITQQCAWFCFRKNHYVCQNSGHSSGRVQLPILCLFHPSSHDRVHRDGNRGLRALHLEDTCGSWYGALEVLKSLAECLPQQWLNKERGFFKSIYCLWIMC